MRSGCWDSAILDAVFDWQLDAIGMETRQPCCIVYLQTIEPESEKVCRRSED